MEGCIVQLVLLFLLLVVGGALAYLSLRRRLEEAERRQSTFDLELARLQRLVAGGAVPPAPEVAAGAAPAEPAEAAAEEAAEIEPAAAGLETPPPVEAAPPPPPLAAGASATIGEPETRGEPEAPEAAPAPPPPTLVEPVPPELAPPEAAPPEEAPPQAEAAFEGVETPPPGLPPPEPPTAPPPSPPRRIDWERWVGVRGAAVLGGAVLALAAILFLKFSIERGLISPTLRVTLGLLAGLGAIGGAEVLRKRAYGAAANALSGAGIVILYASIWAAHRLYGLVPFSLAFGLMVLVTAACGLLSWRHRSLVVATLGLVGGFATPFLLATGPANPIGLFGYILILDVGLLALSRKMGWPVLALLGLAGTLLYQALWVFTQMDAERLVLTLIVLAVFGLLFGVAGAGRGADERERKQSRVTTVGGILLPFAFAAYLASRADLGEHILPIAVLLLLLSAAACWMARVHRIPQLAPGAAMACVAVVAVWAARSELGELTVWELVGVCSALALLFRLFGGEGPAEERWDRLSRLTESAALVAAAGFLLILLIAPLGTATDHLWPWLVGWLVLTLLLVLEARMAPAGDLRRWLAPLAAAGQVAAVGLWVVQRQIGTALAWEVGAVAVALALFHDLAGRRAGRHEAGEPAQRNAPFIAAAGLSAVLALAPLVAPTSGLWPWLAGWVVLAGLLVVRGGVAGEAYRQVVAAAVLGFSFLLYYLFRTQLEAAPPAPVLLGLALAVAVVFQAIALARRRGPVARAAEVAAAVFPAVVLAALLFDVGNAALPGGFHQEAGVLLAVLVALSATRLPSGRLYLGAVAALALTHSSWTAEAGQILRSPAAASWALLIQGAAVLLFTFWPFLAGRRLAADRWALYGSALAGPFWFLSLKGIHEARFGDGAIGALPILLGVATLLAAMAARRLWADAERERRRALVWYLAVTFAFVSVAIPLQLEKEWITVGWALEGLALIALWKRLDHPGLKYLGLALLAAVTLRLILNPAVFGYYPRSGRPIFNWLMYAYLVPAAALLLSSRILAGLEVDRLLGWERSLYELFKRRAMGAIACGLAAILIGFWWINLAVIDYFSVGGELDLTFERLPARDLSLSLSWAVYALILLAVGMARRSVGLRWLSLGFLILTIGKVFLYDLGELRDLYRVASLVGLAVSLLLVSLAYQRFVFGRDRDAGEDRDREET